MDPAEHAGTLESETYPTLDTDEEESSYSYLFLLQYGEEGLVLDSFLDTSILTKPNCYAAVTAAKVAGQLVGKKVRASYALSPEQKSLLKQVKMFDLRSRFQGDTHGPYHLKTTFELTPDELVEYLRAMPLEDRKRFLAEHAF